MNPKAPQILNDIVAALKTANLQAVKEDTDGRIDSKKDEAVIIAWLLLQPQFAGKIKEGVLRAMADMEVTDDGITWHMVNVKTSFGGTDNAFSKLGFLWAFTDLTKEQYDEYGIINKVKDNKFADLVIKHRADIDRDYWFLALDKADFSQVFVRGVKQITHWQYNPTNNLQIEWSKEKLRDHSDQDFDTAYYHAITDGAFRCWYKKSSQWQVALQYRLDNLKTA